MELRRIDLPDAAAAMVLGLGLSQIRRRLLHPYMKFLLVSIWLHKF